MVHTRFGYCNSRSVPCLRVWVRGPVGYGRHNAIYDSGPDVFFFWVSSEYITCTHTHSHLGFLIPRLLDNTQLVFVRTAIVIRVVSFLPDTTTNPRSKAGDGSRRSWSHLVCIMILWTTVSSPYAYTIYTVSRCIYVVAYYHWENWLLTDYGMVLKMQAMGCRPT